MRILEQVPQLSLGGSTETIPEVLLLVALLLRGGQEPPGPVVRVLAARLHVEVVQPPVLQLLAEVLDTDLEGQRKISWEILLLSFKTRCGLSLLSDWKCKKTSSNIF